MRDYGNTNAAPYASAPAVGLAGDTYWNTTQKVLYVSDGTAWAAAGPSTGGHAVVHRAANFQTLANVTPTTLTFDTIDDNVGGLYAAGTPDRFTIVTGGFYMFGGFVSFPSAALNRRLLIVNVNGNQVAGNESQGGVPRFVTATCGALLVAGDIVQCQGYQESGATVTLVTPQRMWICRLS